MTSWRSLGHRGDNTEDIINITNRYYESHGVAVITKMPVPIKVIEIEKSIIKKAFFEEKSTVDYYGVVQGLSIVFDAKETEKKSFPLQNIHEHQIEYMQKIKNQGGLAFIIVNFKYYNEFILIPIEVIHYYYQKSLNGGRKSIPYSVLDKRFTIEFKNGILHYLDTLNVYIRYIEKDKFNKYKIVT
jgi:recombination protein U